MIDKSNGYEAVASKFIEIRGQTLNGIGTSKVCMWAQTLQKKSSILDLGCGCGIPIAKALIDLGFKIYGIDASITLIKAFRFNLPNAHAVCEAAEDSLFFNRKFDAVVSWGMIFLLEPEVQAKVIGKIGKILHEGGKFLFTAPFQKAEWMDALTGQCLRSLGTDKYAEILAASRLSIIDEFEDEGGNHYFNSLKY